VERRPAAAGIFYPAEPEALKVEVERLTASAGDDARRAVAVLVPHAQYDRSGAVAGAVWAAAQVPRTVVLLAPNHRDVGAPLAVWCEGVWHTPLGPVEVDSRLAAALLEACPHFADDPIPHISEHAIEVQLPFLLAKRPEVRIVPVLVSRLGGDDLHMAGEALARVILETESPALVAVTTDMSHFELEEDARRKDAVAIDAIVRVEPVEFLETARVLDLSMCGVEAVGLALYATASLGGSVGRLVDYRFIPAVGGESVMSYAGFLFE